MQLERKELHALATKTRLIINAVGPFHLYGTPVVEACANTGTHYLDMYGSLFQKIYPTEHQLTSRRSGEPPWHLEMIRKFHDTAKANGAIV